MEFTELGDSLIPKIKVIGVGGGGGNAVNHMIRSQLADVQFIVANTDLQAMNRSLAAHKLQLGPKLTRGLGAGGKPQIGLEAAQESKSEIQEVLNGADMVFIAAGMGGGTGTGAAPLVAQIAKEMNILTVAVVTKPFGFEGVPRRSAAEAGVEELRKNVDSLIVIPNERLQQLAPKNATFREMLNKANDVLYQGVKGMAELLTKDGYINVDFADVKAVMSKPGRALMGTGAASGEGRARDAAMQAIHSPLLEDVNIDGAHGILFNITCGESITMEEISEAATTITSAAHPEAPIYYGHVFSEEACEEMRITVIATGIDDGIARPLERPGRFSATGEGARRGAEIPLPIELVMQQRAQLKDARPGSFTPPGDQEKGTIFRMLEDIKHGGIGAPRSDRHRPGENVFDFSEDETEDIPSFIRRQAN